MKTRYLPIWLSLCFVAGTASGVPRVVHLGAEEDVPGADGRLPHIATDSLDQPHIVMDVSGSGLIYFYDKVGGAWQTSSFNSGGSQFYNPHIEINDFDQAWISGVMWYPQGMGAIVRHTMASAPTTVGFTPTKGGAGGLPVGLLSIDPLINGQAIVYAGNGGYWERLLWNGTAFSSGGSGSLGTGSGGEKNGFWVSKADYLAHANGANQAVWHSCSDWSYNNSARAWAGRGAVTWANYANYPWMGDDGCYPTVVSDGFEPQTAYFFTDYTQFGGPGLFMNVWKGVNNAGDGAFVFNPNGGLLLVDVIGTTGYRRFPPQAYPANSGGAWLCYSAGGNIRIRYIPSYVASAADFGDLVEFPGVRGTVCVDQNGNLHVAYLNGGLKYRMITVAGDNTDMPSITQPGDFNGDGVDDLGVFDPNAGAWYILSLGGSIIANSNQWGWAGALPASGDFDGDGADELGAHDPSTGHWYVKELNTNILVYGLPWGGSGSTPVHGDFDNDGADDLAVYGLRSGDWHVWSHKRDEWIGSDTFGGFASGIPVQGDYNGDGLDDLAVFDAASGNWYIKTFELLIKNGMNFGWSGATFTKGDFDGDGADDAVVYDPNKGDWYVMSVVSSKVINWKFNWGFSGAQAVPADYDGDGKTDYAVFHRAAGDWYIIHSSNNASLKTNWGWSDTTPVPADYDGDGRADLAVFHKASGTWYILQSRNNKVRTVNWGWSQTTPVPGDYDRDGKADLAVYHPAGGTWYVWQSSNNKTKSFQWGFNGVTPVPEDFDGDTSDDLAVYDSANGLWYVYSVSRKKQLQVGEDCVIKGGRPVPGNYDGARGADVATIDTTKGNWFIKRLSEVLAWGVNWGSDGMIPVSGDYDADGKADLAVYNTENGNWFIRTLGGKTLFWDHNFGYAGATPVSGRFDKDNYSDLAVYDSSNGNWYIYSVGQDKALAFPVQWGFEGGIPLGGVVR